MPLSGRLSARVLWHAREPRPAGPDTAPLIKRNACLPRLPGSELVPLRSRLPLPPGPLLGFGLAGGRRHRHLRRSLIAPCRPTPPRPKASRHTISVIDQMQTRAVRRSKMRETGQRRLPADGRRELPRGPIPNAISTPAEGDGPRRGRLLADNPQQQQRIDALDGLLKQKARTSSSRRSGLRREGKVVEAIAVVRTDRGKTAMDGIRRDGARRADQ